MEEQRHNINGDGQNDNNAENSFHNYNAKKELIFLTYKPYFNTSR